MIKRVSSNHASFKTVEFKPGFNVVLAERTHESTKLDSRNGLGKSTLIEIIHFCLGAKAAKGKGLLVDALSGWAFTVELEVGGRSITAIRSIDAPNDVVVNGLPDECPFRPKKKKDKYVFSVRDWNLILGGLFFGLPSADDSLKYEPTFRSLFSYFVRRQKDAYFTPFEHHGKQAEWARQVNNAFLLGLAWENAVEVQVLKDRKKGLEGLIKAAKTGVLKGFVGSRGDLEARRVRLSEKATEEAANLESFKVHPQYEDIRMQANQLTEEIHVEANQNAKDQRMLSLYEKSLSEENAPVPNAVEKLYADAGVALPGVALRRIEDVQAFHHTIIENRRLFLEEEVSRLKRAIVAREQLIKEKSDKRAVVMDVLRTHGALEEYTLLQKRHLDTQNTLNSITATIDNLKSCETGMSQFKIDQQVLQQRSLRDYEERREIRETAIRLFNRYSQGLYSVPGKLVIDVGLNGFKFDVEIERSGSTGIDNMKVFCYDMSLSSMWARKIVSPGILIHDSLIFDGVDERQRALALEIAAKDANSEGFQYICTLNSDAVPYSEFSSGFDIKKYVRLTLTDADQTGCLLGIRY